MDPLKEYTDEELDQLEDHEAIEAKILLLEAEAKNMSPDLRAIDEFK